MKFLKSTILTFVIFSFCACATLFQHDADKIPVDSNPQGARVMLNGQVVGYTPCVASINHSEDADISIDKEGYQKIQLQRGKVISGWFVADVISLAGVIIDLATYNQGHYPSDPIFAELQKK